MPGEKADNPTLAAAPVPRLPQAGRNLRLISFYVGVPLLIGIYGALNNWELLESAGYPLTLAFYAAHACPPWWMTCLCTSLSMWTLRPLKPNQYVLMTIGAILGGLVALPYTNWLAGLAGDTVPDSLLMRQVAPIFSADFWRYILRATLIWYGINFVFDRFLGLPRYRYVIPRGYDELSAGGETGSMDPSASDVGDAKTALPGFAERIPARIGIDDILGIKAEQHYIRVFTPDREYMVLYRFSDAVRELDSSLGLQVHRSYWVSKNAIEIIRPSAKKFSIRLASGAIVPVSTPYHGVVKEFARTNQIPMR
ncbi:MAG: LytTR family transcriptional regulator [Gammaproteobacteria bacterium]|nr:LytTR family transcriptional regulator [Gammaproteobacteria bacterium]MBT8443422.1 LytTR family transcriptional regulator [Gammaproteobacteria bacterium]NND35951.1 LytTR family transcriptional regulator [Gammaproteobacteria bacterium]